MQLTPDHIKFAQAELKRLNLYSLAIDGDAGAGTKAALDKVTELPKTWTLEKKLVGLLQLQAKKEGLDPGPIDGLWGQRTAVAYDQLVQLRKFGELPVVVRPDDRPAVGNPNNWPSQRDIAKLNAHYGQPGTNLVTIDVPYELVISYDPTKKTKRITCNKKVADSVLRVLNKVLQTYGLEEIKRLRLNMYAGCFQERAVRNGTRPSMHSWGIALDWDHNNNQLNWSATQATLARPEYDRWWQIWEEEGWVSLGRQRNFDWMHVQAATL